MATTIVTIGVYGFDEQSFFGALQDAKIDTFCDIRLRRGMRGSTYAFVNSEYLQRRLSELGIRYVNLKDLAPSQTIRDLQKQADAREGVAKRSRTELGEAFIEAYEHECLSAYDSKQFLQEIGPEAHVVGLFCVEREPEACHRSLAARKLSQELHLPIQHIKSRLDNLSTSEEKFNSIGVNIMERVLIVAKTHMGSGVCIGGLTREQNRSVRVLPPEGQNHPADTRLDVGQVWEFEFHDAPDIKPPHVEDIIVTSGKLVGHVSNMREILLEHVHPWEGGPEQLYDGLLTIANSKGYISEQNPLPQISTGFWIPDRPLTLNSQSNPPKPYYSLVLGDGTAKGQVDFLNIPFVGFAEPITQIPAGTLVRVSLARWFDQNGRTEKRCYLQLSGWYL